jgi:hypothetical protein
MTRKHGSGPGNVSMADIDDRGELLRERHSEHDASVSASLSGGDIDARWDQAESSGEESVGGSAPTPDQDVVDEIGEAAGVTYQDGEPLRAGEKEEERDEHRWELDPASSEDYAERSSSRDERAEPILAMKHRDRYRR